MPCCLDLGMWSCGSLGSAGQQVSAAPIFSYIHVLLYTVIMNAQRILAKFICGYFQSLGDFRYMILSLENEENNPCEVNVLKQN